MKVFNKIVPYRLRLALIGVAGGATMMTACSKDKDEPQPTGPAIELTFSQIHLDDVKPDAIRAVLSTPDGKAARKIYLVSDKEMSWSNINASGIANLRSMLLEPALKVSPKVWGKGDFDFEPGVVSKDDSLWYVQHGWTINKGR